MPSPTRIQNSAGRVRANNQQKILRAAEREFEAHGFGGARVQRIADLAGVPKANIHYYYKNKKKLYLAVLDGILSLWNKAFDDIHPDDDPAQALAKYIRAKLNYSRHNARAARIFASEIIHGAPNLRHYLKTESRQWVTARAEVIEDWVRQGKIDPVDPLHLIFLIWGATQHYADYNSQISLIYAKPKLDDSDFEAITDSITSMILKGCGLTVPVEETLKIRTRSR